MTDREQDLRLRCLELANCQQWHGGKPEEVIASARKMADFVMTGTSQGGVVGLVGAAAGVLGQQQSGGNYKAGGVNYGNVA